jgi:ribulose-5-phosphate 4-epimerase/fuculose-1-phosphate aldolase
MTDLIFTHISVRIPGPEHHFLINPYGLMFDEITASNLVKIDLDGNAVEPSPYPVNPAGFVIHSAIHGAREDAQCVLHTHTKSGCAMAALKCGLLPVNQISMEFYNRVAYHDYEGVALDMSEQRRLVADMGDKPVLMLRNHGLLTVGGDGGAGVHAHVLPGKGLRHSVGSHGCRGAGVAVARGLRAYRAAVQ